MQFIIMQSLLSKGRRAIGLTIGITAALTMTPGISSGASVEFYSTRSAFDAAAPGMPVEGFEKATVSSASTLLQSSPLNSSTNNADFASGSILPGLTISNLSSANTPGLIVYGDGAIFGGTKSVGTNWFGDSLVLTFGPAVSSVAADVFAATSPGLTLAGDFTADVFDGSTLLASTMFSEARGDFGFVGLTSTSPITSIVLLYTTDDATTFADNVAFGSTAVGPSSSPEPSPLQLLALSGALFGIGIAATRKVSSRR